LTPALMSCSARTKVARQRAEPTCATWMTLPLQARRDSEQMLSDALNQPWTRPLVRETRSEWAGRWAASSIWAEHGAQSSACGACNSPD